MMIKMGIFGTLFGFIFSALGKGQVAKFISICTVLTCVIIIGDQVVGVIMNIKEALSTL